MASDNGKKYILSDVEDFAKKNSFNDTFKIAKTWEEIGFHVSALSYNGFRVITLSRWGSGVFQLFFNGDTFLKTRYSLGIIHYAGITQWTKDYIDNPYGIQRIWFNIKNGYQEGDKHHYKEFLKNKNKVHIDENMKKQTIKLKESQLRNFIKESMKKVLKEGESIVEFNNLDAIFNENFGDVVRISRFYSDVNNVVVAVQRQAYGTIAEKVTSIMDEFGYTLSDVGANGEVVMMTFGVANNTQNEPVASTINESKLINMIKESIKKTLKESVIKSREFLDKNENICYGEDEMSFFAANYLRNEFRRFHDITQAKACAQEMLQREKRQRAEEMSGLRY